MFFCKHVVVEATVEKNVAPQKLSPVPPKRGVIFQQIRAKNGRAKKDIVFDSSKNQVFEISNGFRGRRRDQF